MKSLEIRSPAKINLDLRILARYPDGYHQLLTLFQRISLFDQLKLSIRKSPGITILCRHPGVPADARNIMAKAYSLLLERFPRLPGVSVCLLKKVPVAAGLGGGSANAAAFLLGMKRLCRLRLAQRDLLKMGARLGADVPFFLTQTSQALGTGRGDTLRPVRPKRRRWLVLIPSRTGLSTRDVYLKLPRRLPAVSLTKLERTVRIATHFLDQGKPGEAGKILKNDLEKPAFELRPSIRATVRQAVRLGAPLVRMSGSGPTVFALFSSQKEARVFARQVHRVLKKQAIVCHSC